MATPGGTSSVPEALVSTALLNRITGVFWSPKATFQSIAVRPTWVGPLMLLCVMQIAVVAIYSRHVGWRGMLEKQDENNSRIAQMSPDQRARALELQVKYAPLAAYFSALIGPFLSATVVGGILLGVFNGLAGTRMSYKTALGVVSFAWLPGLVAGLIGIATILLTDSATVDLQNVIASNPGVILSDDSPRWMLALAGSLDIFSFWRMALMALGFHAANPRKISFGKAFSLIFLTWVAYVIVKVVTAVAFSLLN